MKVESLEKVRDLMEGLQTSYSTCYIQREMLKQAMEAMIRSLTLEGKFEPNEADLEIINRVKPLLKTGGLKGE